MKLGLEIAGLRAGGGPGALDEGGLEPRRSPRFREGRLLRIRVERRLPALSSFLGHRPAQEIRCPAVGKRLMSRPISARMTQALNSLMPGMVVKSWTAARKGSTRA
jgi:hypothetical protein